MQINFINKRFGFYGVAVTTTLIAILSILFLPLNLGIDMTGWVQAEFEHTSNISKAQVEEIKTQVEEIKKTIKYDWKEFINNTLVYQVTWEKKFIVEAWFNKITSANEQKIDELKTQFKTSLQNKLNSIKNNEIKLSKYVNIWESFWEYIKKTAYITIIVTILAISLYISWAFRGSIEWFSSFPFAAVTMVSLFHDVLVALGFYLITSYFLPEFKVDTFFITAMLTVLGYSVSDTIVIMDRIRSNLSQKIAKKLDFWTLINNSINETLKRSIFTSLTVFMTLVAMFIFGPVSIKWFILAMMYGTIFWTYSSIAIAAPLLYDISGKK